jgi:hypothetical protein
LENVQTCHQLHEGCNSGFVAQTALSANLCSPIQPKDFNTGAVGHKSFVSTQNFLFHALEMTTAASLQQSSGALTISFRGWTNAAVHALLLLIISDQLPLFLLKCQMEDLWIQITSWRNREVGSL